MEPSATNSDFVFWAHLAEQLNEISAPEEVISVATEALAIRLHASRCFAAEVFDQEAKAVVHHDFAVNLPSLKGSHDLNGFGPKLLDSWRSDPIVIVTDVKTDPRTIDFANNHLQLGIRSFISIRIIRKGVYSGVVNVTSHESRQWTRKEAELTRSVSESVWSAFERARLMTALKESEQTLRNLADSLPLIVWSSKPNGEVLFFNRRWEEFTGNSVNDKRYTVIAEAAHPEDQRTNVERWSAVQETGGTFENEYRLRARDGSYHWFLGRAVPVESENGELIRWFGTATNIDAQKKAADEQKFLAEATALLANSLDYEATLEKVAHLSVTSLADWCSIQILDRERPRTVAVAHPDPAMQAMGKELGEKYPTDWESATGVANVIRTGRSEVYNNIPVELLKASSKDEEHFRILQSLGMTSAMIIPIAARGKTLGALTLISTKPERQYTKENLAFAEELGRRAGIAVDNAILYEQAQNAIAMRDEFLSIASHELRTPLTSLKLQMQIFARQLQKGDGTVFDKEYIKNINEVSQRQVNQLTRLVEDMLDVSRIESGKLKLDFETIRCADIVRSSFQNLGSQFQQANVQVALDLDDSLMVRADAFRLDQVMTNLLTNALKYGLNRPVEVRLFREAKQAVLEVRDYGMGLEPQNIERIFGRYERAISASTISGLGLGLYISRQIIESHHGTISVKSAVNQGSVFRIELPLA